ncbi:MAG: protein involved in polysaccharide export, contains domain of the beta-grasp fold [Fibrobacteres bacterium]|nr:protein involved in polysaccharide export, contains domain of the beta-grasp fold [Fibrobacterota bacterium]
MPITYRSKAPLFLLLLVPLSMASQTLEEKVTQARKMQAESMLGMDSAVMDSLVAEKKNQNKASTGRNRSALTENVILDSLLSGPGAPEAQGGAMTEYTHGDSSAKSTLTHKTPPKRYEQRVFQSIDRSIFSSASGAAGRDYVLGPGDEITVSIWGDKEKEYNLDLNRDGKVFMEGIGLVALAGQNLDGARQVLKQRLSKVYSGISRGSTSIDVSLGKTGPMRVFMLGEVKLPGGFVFSGASSALTALYYAKGPTDIGTVRNLILNRAGTKYPLDLYKFLMHGDVLTPNALQDGDVIFAGRAEALVDISGDVGRAAVYELKKGEGVKEILDFAGGINATAAAHKMTLQRIFPDGKPGYVDLAVPQDYISGKAKMELQDGDKIVVEKSSEMALNFLTITGPVKYPGNYESTDVTTVDQLVAKAGGLREDAFLSRVHVLRFNPEGSSKMFAYSLDSTLMESIPLKPRDNVLLYSLKDMYLPDSVEISGAVFYPGKFEFREGMTVMDLVMQAGGLLPHHESGKAMVFRGALRKHSVEQITLNAIDSQPRSETHFHLNPNDFVQIPIDPEWYQKEIVSLEGLFIHPGKYSLLYPGEKLTSVVQRAGGFKANAYIEGGRFFRSKDSVGRVGVDMRKALEKPKSKSNIPLIGGDSIFVPERLNTVKVIGEVGFETSLLLKEGASVQYYIESAGGFTRRSEKNRVVVQYANGETSRDGYFNRKPDAGSVIYIPQGPEPKPIDWLGGINGILGTLGVAAAIILSVQAIKN